MLANDTEYGLAAYFFTRDLRRAWHIAEQLEYGMVGRPAQHSMAQHNSCSTAAGPLKGGAGVMGKHALQQLQRWRLAHHPQALQCI